MSGAEKTRVRVTGPAKVGARWFRPGDQDVTAEELAALRAEGLVGEDAVAEDEFGEALEPRTFSVAEFEAAVSAASKPLKARIAELEAQLAAQDARVDTDATASADDAPEHTPTEETPSGTDTPPSSTAAKTTRKKGAAATPKG